jgi:hypothetical protein
MSGPARPQAGAGGAGATPPGATLGPTTARNWGWVLSVGAVAALLAASAAEATLRLGPGWRATALPLLLAAPLAAAAVWLWRLPPFERCSLRLTADGVAVSGRRETVHLRWDEIAAVSHRPGALGPAHLALERAAGTGGAGAAPGVIFPVRATGARMEDVVAFLARGAARSGYRLEEAGRRGAARHALPGPRLWHVVPA